ncbi:MAG: DUF3046 domain-containing protein [Candidatus Nanopelagicales bacterium]|jgi:hypothetical protein
MRLTEFWNRMEGQFGPEYARSWATDYVLPELGGLSVMQAIDFGYETKTIWLAVVKNQGWGPEIR